jgi:DNA-binding NtrC family response regulator
LGRNDESLRESRILLELDPVSETPTGYLAWALRVRHQFDDAIAQSLKDLQLYPDATQDLLKDAYYAKGMFREAAAQYLKERERPLTKLSVEDAMKKAGYRPAIASSGEQLTAALRSRRWDVIIVDGADTASLATQIQQSVHKPHLVPVLSRAAKSDLKQAERTYDTVINTPSKNRTFVDTVDDAMDLHEAEAAAAAKAANRSAR